MVGSSLQYIRIFTIPSADLTTRNIFLELLLQAGADRILFSADYPFCALETTRAFLGLLPVSPADRHKIANINAERLLGETSFSPSKSRSSS